MVKFLDEPRLRELVGYIKGDIEDAGKTDNTTVTRNSADELQANSIIHVDALPTLATDIKPNSIYALTETVVIDEGLETQHNLVMDKHFVYTASNWKSISTIAGLTENEYNQLSSAQKVDGTIYVVENEGNVIKFLYDSIGNKPRINSVVLQGNVTLTDLNLYSKDEVDALLEGKVEAEFVDRLPDTLADNTWYYTKTYADGTPVADDKRALYLKDHNGVTQYMGVMGNVDLSDYYTKLQSEYRFQKLVYDSEIASLDDGTKISGFNQLACTTLSFSLGRLWSWLTNKIATMYGRGINRVDDIIGHSNSVTASSTNGLKSFTHDEYGHVTASTEKTIGRGLNDSSNVIGHSNSAITAKTSEGLATIKYDQYGHITGGTGKSLGRGLSDSSNTIGHSNSAITAKSNTNIVGMSYDEYGHITGKGSTEYSVSDTYTSNANNQLFTRHGANTFYSNVFNGQYNVVFCGNFTRNSTHSISSNTSTYIPLTGADQYRGSLCYRSGNAIYIATTGTYMVLTTARLQDTGTSTRAWYLGTGTTTMYDDSAGGTWNYTYNRHKAQSIEIRYLTAGTLLRPFVYIDSNSGTLQYVTMSVFKLNEK